MAASRSAAAAGAVAGLAVGTAHLLGRAPRTVAAVSAGAIAFFAVGAVFATVAALRGR